MTSHRGKSITDIDLHVATRLIAARRACGLSQHKAAKAGRVSFQQIQKYEKGTNRISAGKLFLLAQLYGKSIEWFFEGAGKPVNGNAVDLGAEMLSRSHGADMARAFADIKDNDRRKLVTDLARALS